MHFFHFLPFPVVYVVISEIFPMGIRGRAVSVVSAVNWATNLLISMTFLTVTGVSCRDSLLVVGLSELRLSYKIASKYYRKSKHFNYNNALCVQFCSFYLFPKDR